MPRKNQIYCGQQKVKQFSTFTVLYLFFSEGILAKLEPPWKAINQEDVGLYYFNFETGDSMWEHPNDQYYRQKVARERDRIKNKHKSPKVSICDLSMSV